MEHKTSILNPILLKVFINCSFVLVSTASTNYSRMGSYAEELLTKDFVSEKHEKSR